MNIQSHIVSTETDQAEDALHALLVAAIRADDEQAREPDADRPAISVRDSLSGLIEGLRSFTPVQRSAADLLKRPVGEATRRAIRVIGERLHEIGGLKLMDDVFDRVAEREAAKADRRMGIMSTCWDGIGRSKISVGWCL